MSYLPMHYLSGIAAHLGARSDRGTAGGSSNAGHEFGTQLADEERWNLVEGLKTL